jgi:hypothetical protein
LKDNDGEAFAFAAAVEEEFLLEANDNVFRLRSL